METVAKLREAARRAGSRGASESAVAFLRRALAEPPDALDRPDVLVELGSAEIRVSGEAAVEHLEEARELIDDPVKKAELALLLGRQLYLLRGEESDAVLTQALVDLDGADAELERLLQAGLITNDLFAPGLQHRALTLLDRVRERPAADTFGEKVLLSLLAHYEARTGQPAAEVVPVARRALAEGALIRDDVSGTVFIPPVMALAMADLDEALVIFEDALAEARRRGSTLAFAAVKVFRLLVLVWRGDLVEAEAEAREALALGRAWGPTARFYGHASAFLADALMEQGRLDDAAAALATIAFRESRLDSERVLFLRDSSARLRILRGDPAGGAEQLLEAGRGFDEVGAVNPAFIAWRSPAALALLQLERDDEARSWRRRSWSSPAPGELLARSPAALAHGGPRRGRRARPGAARRGRSGGGELAREARARQGAHRAWSCAAEGQSPLRRARASSAGGRAGDDLRRHVPGRTRRTRAARHRRAAAARRPERRRLADAE